MLPLELQWQQAKIEGIESQMRFFEGLEYQPLREKDKEYLLGLLQETKRPEDRLVALSVAQIFAFHRSIDMVEKLKAAAEPLPEFAATRDYRLSIWKSINFLGMVRDGMCICEAHMANTDAPYDRDLERGETRVPKADEPLSVTIITCKLCKRKYEITEDISFHYPVFSWKAL